MKNKRRITSTFGVSLLLIIFCTACTTFQDQPKKDSNPEELVIQDRKVELYQVARVVDGDTLVVNINDKDEKVRLLGINTPETVDPRKSVECFGKEASKKASELLEGQSVRLENDLAQLGRDRYDRLLRYVFLEDGTNVSEKLIREGYGYEYTYEKPYKYQEKFKEAQKEAEQEKKGLWADGVCEIEQPKNTQPELEPIFVPEPKKEKLSKCSPNYSGCVPIDSDVDCAGGSGTGPSYANGPVDVIGRDIYGLDRDGDGIACE